MDERDARLQVQEVNDAVVAISLGLLGHRGADLCGVCILGEAMSPDLRWEAFGPLGRTLVALGWMLMWSVVFPIGALTLMTVASAIGDAMLTR